MSDEEDRARKYAVVFVLTVLRTPLMLMSPDRAAAIDLARKYNLTAEDLLNSARKGAENA